MRVQKEAASALATVADALEEARRHLTTAQRALAGGLDEDGQEVIPVPADCTMRQAQCVIVRHVVAQEGGKAQAARKLKISRRGVYNLLR